jgi:hypothetical protein
MRVCARVEKERDVKGAFEDGRETEKYRRDDKKVRFSTRDGILKSREEVRNALRRMRTISFGSSLQKKEKRESERARGDRKKRKPKWKLWDSADQQEKSLSFLEGRERRFI